MKYFFTIFLVHLLAISFGQIKLENTYFNPKDLAGYELTFKENGMFECCVRGCLYNATEFGTYTIKGKKLSLHFTVPDSLKNSFTTKDTLCSSDDSVTFTFLVVDHKETIPYAGVQINTQDTPHFMQTNINGRATYKLKNDHKEIEVLVNSVGLKPISFKLQSDHCKDIVIRLISPYSASGDGEEWTYKIKRKHLGNIVLIDKRTKLRFMKYEK